MTTHYNAEHNRAFRHLVKVAGMVMEEASRPSHRAYWLAESRLFNLTDCDYSRFFRS